MIAEALKNIANDWQPIVDKALQTMSSAYWQDLQNRQDTLPAQQAIFSAFSLPLAETRFILLGESPYPRAASANGYAFWDAAVGPLWSSTGFSKPVNRATSLRNWLKMLLLARGDLQQDFSQAAIANLQREQYVATAAAFFTKLLQQGFLLLNASLIYSPGKVPYHAKAWRPFIECLLAQIAEQRPDIQLLLLGNFAKNIRPDLGLTRIEAEHPYNLSFIQNQKLIEFFKPFDLLAL